MDLPGWLGDRTVQDGWLGIEQNAMGMRVGVYRAAEPTRYLEKGFLSPVGEASFLEYSRGQAKRGVSGPNKTQ